MSQSRTVRPSLRARIGWPNILYVLFLVGCVGIVLFGEYSRYSVIGGMSLWVTGTAAYLVACLLALLVAWAKGWAKRKILFGLGLSIFAAAIAWPLSLTLVRVVERMHYG